MYGRGLHSWGLLAVHLQTLGMLPAGYFVSLRRLFSVFNLMLSCVKCNVKPELSVCKMDICCIKMKCQELGRSRASARSDKHRDNASWQSGVLLISLSLDSEEPKAPRNADNGHSDADFTEDIKQIHLLSSYSQLCALPPLYSL